MRHMHFLAAALLLLGAFGCQKLPTEASNDFVRGEYHGPVTGLDFQLSETGDAQVELVTDMLYDPSGDSTFWGAITLGEDGGRVTTRSGYFYNVGLFADGVQQFGSVRVGGIMPHNYWTDENQGTFAEIMVLADTTGTRPWVWQKSNSTIGQVRTVTIEAMNWSSGERLGVVGTMTGYVHHPADLEHDIGIRYLGALPAFPGDHKLAVVDMDSRVGLGDSVTVWVNGTELTHFVSDFVHERHPNVPRYYRFSLLPDGTVVSLGDENRFTYGNRIWVTNPNLDPGETVYLESPGLTSGERRPMIYIGDYTWELKDLTTWVGRQDARITTQGGPAVFRTVRYNNDVLHHAVGVPLDPEPPVQVLRFTALHNHMIVQGDNTLNAVIDVESDG